MQQLTQILTHAPRHHDGVDRTCRHDLRPREQWRLEAAERAITATYRSMMGLPPGSAANSGATSLPTAAAASQNVPGALTPAQAAAAQLSTQQAAAAAVNSAPRWVACSLGKGAVPSGQAANVFERRPRCIIGGLATAVDIQKGVPTQLAQRQLWNLSIQQITHISCCRPSHAKRPAQNSQFYLKLNSDQFTNARSTTIRCVCGDNADRGHMIQCEVSHQSRSRVWHAAGNKQILACAWLMRRPLCYAEVLVYITV